MEIDRGAGGTRKRGGEGEQRRKSISIRSRNDEDMGKNDLILHDVVDNIFFFYLTTLIRRWFMRLQRTNKGIFKPLVKLTENNVDGISTQTADNSL